MRLEQTYVTPAVFIAVRIGTGKDMEIKLVDKPVFVMVQQAVDYVSGHGRRNPLAGMNASLNPDVGLALSGLQDLEDFHVTAFMGLADGHHLHKVKLAFDFIQIGVQLNWEVW